MAHPDRVVDAKPWRAYRPRTRSLCDSVSRKTRAIPRSRQSASRCSISHDAHALAPVVDEHLVEHGLGAARLDRPSPGDDGVAGRRQPHDAVPVVVEQRCEAVPCAVGVERVTVDRAEPLMERDQRVEVCGDRPGGRTLQLTSQPASEIAFATAP